MSIKHWPETTVLGVRVHTLSYSQVLDIIRRQLCDPENTATLTVITPNPEIVVYAQRHPAYKMLLNQANLALPDGIGLVLTTAGRIRKRVTGVDVVAALLQEVERLGLTLGIVHRHDGLATVEQMTAGLQQRYPNLQLQFSVADFNLVPDVIIITLGYPEQEQWFQHRQERYANTKLVLAVGGAIDFLIGVQPRAPGWFRAFGVEWLWRLWQQPRRWRRIITAVLIFPWMMLRQLIVKQSTL